MQFTTKPFHELSSLELYRMLQLRSEVFVVEQDCPYLDPDGFDENAFHVLGRINAKICAYTRIVAPGEIYSSYACVGRVVTASAIRKTGFGRPLMEFTISECQRLFPDHDIKISAQSYLINFYKSLEFKTIGAEYLEDNIPHIAMIYKKQTRPY